MKDNQPIKFNELLRLFIIVNYLRGNKYFDRDLLEDYLVKVFNNIITNLDIESEINNMLEERIVNIKSSYDYLITIIDEKPLLKLLGEKFECFDNIVKLVNGYIDYTFIEKKDNYEFTDAIKNLFVLDDNSAKKLKKELL